MALDSLSDSAHLKLDLMFEGVRYSEALGRASEHSFPNYYPYRFQPAEPNPTGNPTVVVPYLMSMDDGTLIRVKGNHSSPWVVEGTRESGYLLAHDQGKGGGSRIRFEPLPRWMGEKTNDGFPMAMSGVSLHGDMAVVNAAPGCDYFLEKGDDGRSLRCTFCTYGAPNERVAHFGQTAGEATLPGQTYDRLRETLAAVLEEGGIRHVYLVAGSLPDWHREGERFIELATVVQEVVQQRVPVTCGSGALPQEKLQALHLAGLVDSVCFNLEIWSEELFARVCPGKQQFVGYRRWIESLENAVGLWGRGRVYSAMVAGIELGPEFGIPWKQAADLALEGAEDLCSRGIIPVYSLYWPPGAEPPEYFDRLRAYFERLNLGYQAIREKHGLRIWDGFMCQRCAYMQLECDLDRLTSEGGA